ncbi:MAG: hypothetical protein AAB802_03715 [Patescibacteria group bacterium]
MKKILLTVAITFASLILLLLAFVFLGSSGVADAADQILVDFENGQFEKVYTESLLDDEFSLEELQVAFGVGTPYDITKATKKSWSGRGFDGPVKYIYGDFVFPNGEELPLTFKFVEENGDLKLVGIVSEPQ